MKFAVRQLRKRPGFTIVSIAVLGLGLGANATIFSVVNGVLLRPLPFADPDRLTALFERDVVGEEPFNVVAPANFLDWRRDARTFEQIAASGETQFNLASKTGSFTPERIDGSECSANFFRTLGVSPLLGRSFSEAEDRPGAPKVAIISYGLWMRRFGGSGDVLHRQIRLNSESYEIIAVMPANFSFPFRTVQAWVPMQRFLPAEELNRHSDHFLNVIGRLRPGVTVDQARAEIDGMVKRYKRQHPEEIMGKGGNVIPLYESSVREIRTSLLILFGAVGCVLLIACVNLTNLLLTRAIGRQREIAIRAAIGASHGRIIRQLLTECILLSLLGAVAGLVLASFATPLLASRAPRADYLPQVQNIQVDHSVFFFTFAAALLSGIGAGLFPAFQASRLDLAAGLKDTSRSATPGHAHRRFRDVLVASEVALSLVLLVAAGLMLRSFAELRQVHTGVRADHTLTMAVALPDAVYKEPAKVSVFYQQLAERLKSLPGVQSVGLVTCAPVGGHCSDNVFEIEGHSHPPGKLMDALLRGADPGYFAAAGIPLLRGHPFTSRDGMGLDEKHPKLGAAVVSESFVKAFLPNDDPIGKRISMSGDPNHAAWEIIGVAGDVVKRIDARIQPTMYLPLLDGGWDQAYIVMHTSVEPHSVAPAAHQEVRRLDPDLPVFEIRTLDEIIGSSAQDRNFSIMLLGLFAGLAVVLATIGLYGVLSYAVSQRIGEIGIRIALGAGTSEVRRLVLFQGLKPALLGVVAGLVGAALATKLMRSLLFEVTPGDPATFAAVPLVLLLVATVACYVPARRATRIDPTVALRSE